TRCEKQALVYPWCLIPDRAIVAITAVLLLPYLPLFVATIFMAMSSQAILDKVNSIFFGIPKRIWLFFGDIGVSLGKYLVKDERDAPKVMPTLWLMFWTPIIFAWVSYRSYSYGFEWWLVLVYHLLRIGPRYRFFAYLYV